MPMQNTTRPAKKPQTLIHPCRQKNKTMMAFGTHGGEKMKITASFKGLIGLMYAVKGLIALICH